MAHSRLATRGQRIDPVRPSTTTRAPNAKAFSTSYPLRSGRRFVNKSKAFAPFTPEISRAAENGAWLPGALGRKYPGAARDWRWAWLFPSRGFMRDARSVQRLRWHIYPTTVQRAVATAGRAADINKRVTPHIFRRSFATQLLRSGYDIRTVQELLGHRDVSTPMIYLHVLETGTGVRSPLDQIALPAAGPPPPAPPSSR